MHGVKKLLLEERKKSGTEANDGEESTDFLTDYIPCGSYKELQELDEKFRTEESFFEEAVSKI